MDWIDRLSIWAIVLIIISSFALIANHVGEAKPERPAQQRTSVEEYSSKNAEIDGRVKLIRNLMESDNPGKAETMARELIQQSPYDGGLHMTMGDIFMRRQDPVRAVFEYKEAIDINPDFLDKKTPLFQGKKIKAAVTEALAENDRKIRLAPDDESLKRERKTIYYLQRKIAGSCG
jgi:tetratricopeptide (TPR) repeat protein